MDESRFKQLLEAYVTETLSASDKITLFSMVEDSAYAPVMEEIMQQDWKTGRYEGEPDKELEHLIKNAVNKKLDTQSAAHHIHFFKTTWFRYAAAVIIMIIGAAIWYIQNNHSKSSNPLNHSSRQLAAIQPGRDKAILTLANGQQIMLDSTQGNVVKQGGLTVVNLAGKLKYEGVGTNAEYNILSTPKGGQYQIVLPDGSKVWLNAASSIKFPTAFTNSERNVEITGEAYMEIARNPKQSFKVRTNGTEIQVLGTSFNVNAYPDESAIKTTLIEGSVKVISGMSSNASIILKPGQQVLVSSDQQLNVVNNADIEQALAWKNGVFQLSHISLAETMRQLARWYDIEVVYDNGVPDVKLDGEMKRDLTLSQLLDALSELGVKFRMEGGRLIVMQ